MTLRNLRLAALAGVAAGTVFTAGASAQDCPAITVAEDQGLHSAIPYQFELAEFESAGGGCTLTFSENPDIDALNARIVGNSADLPPVAERLPSEPLVMVPFSSIGSYGGVLNGLSNATEAGTSDLLSVRHVNLVRYSDDLQTIVPNVATGWQWNEDFTQLTFGLRAGHRWSDGAPFTAHDIVFWYSDMVLNPNIIESPRDIWLVGGEPMQVEALDDTTVRFTMPSPKPGLLASLAVDYAQPFQPRHFLSQFHPDHNADADALAEAAGFESGYELIGFYYGGSDWKDVPSPILRDVTRVPDLPAAVLPTLESHVLIDDTTEGRRLVANPYFHMVDPSGQQLPYISEIDERYVPDNEVRLLMLVNGEVDYKSQSLRLPDAPTMLDGQESGNYTVELRPQIGYPVFSFNMTIEDEARRALFGDQRFRIAMSHAIDRHEINSVAYFDLGEVRQYVGFDPVPSFVTDDQLSAYTEYDPDFTRSELDALGMVDADGDGFRDLPNGDALVLSLQFAVQGFGGTVAEFIAQDFLDVGINASSREVTTDEYRAAQSANELNIHLWQRGRPLPSLLGDPQEFTLPFADYFGHRNGMLWQRWLESDGSDGLEPPAWAVEMGELMQAWQRHEPGSAESDALGHQLVQMLVDNHLFTGVAQAPGPIYRSNNLHNFRTPLTWSYDFYRVYPYNPQQWWLEE